MTSESPRLQALDALRGFDMFWIMGGAELVQALRDLTGWRALQAASLQLRHAPWHGFHAEDLIFPLFLFISGVTVPFSLVRARERGQSVPALLGRILRRAALLVLLGLVVEGVLRLRFADQRWCSVLGRIGLAWAGAAGLALAFRPRGLAICAATLLLGYWALMAWVPVPGFGPGVLTPEGNLAGYLDRLILPGKLLLGVHDPEGLLATLPAVATALLGVLTGHHLRATRADSRRSLGLALAGAALLAAGWLWHPLFPVNKSLWTSSFVLVAGGWSLLLLALFHELVDVRGWRGWCRPFLLVGLNPILIYVAQNGLVDFGATTRFLFGGIVRHLPAAWGFLAFILGLLAVKLALLAFLDRQRVYLKV